MTLRKPLVFAFTGTALAAGLRQLLTEITH
jgi:hypothetical protein